MVPSSPETAGAVGWCPRRMAFGGWLAAAALCLALGGSTSCTGDSPESGDGAPSSAADATGSDITSDCRGLETSDSCRSRVGCTWVTVTCDTGRVVGGCFAASTGTQIEVDCDRAPGAESESGTGGDTCVGSECEAVRDAGSDAGTFGDGSGGIGDGGSPDADGSNSDASTADTSAICGSYTSPNTCEADSRCRWWTGTCDGQVVREECIAQGATAPSVYCDAVAPKECHKADSESTCPASSCEWVEDGCGGGSSNTLQLTECLPDGSCSSDADCPVDHGCASLWIDPCANSACTACGQTVDRCVPDKYLSP